MDRNRHTGRCCTGWLGSRNAEHCLGKGHGSFTGWRALRRLKRDYPDSPYLFTTERQGPLTDSAVRKIVTRAGEVAKFAFPIHPHMLRHSTGYKLANDGHDTRAIQQYLGHKNIQHTVRYTQLSAARFKDFWKD
ncbi:tyrosine-type recombinase/integrase [Aeoliella mucimassa]|uniref:Tyrosine recombinase XerC n=1 Tax=Aeoliella mucimassa TaxID=2527972 RepID=A0A518AGL1_9BACT|nr:tyrosine-type recombinase/integrase [Aeoliella mucimassa]QDU53857.1 Tyrosine recombinase XerC [Aeoliella mucimassa]